MYAGSEFRLVLETNVLKAAKGSMGTQTRDQTVACTMTLGFTADFLKAPIKVIDWSRQSFKMQEAERSTEKF